MFGSDKNIDERAKQLRDEFSRWTSEERHELFREMGFCRCGEDLVDSEGRVSVCWSCYESRGG